MTKKILLLFIFAMSLVGNSFAQEVLSARDSTRLNKIEKKAEKEFKEYAYALTIDIYERRLKDEKFSNAYTAKLLRIIGDSYYFNGDYKKANENYRKLFKKFPNTVGSDSYYRYAQSLKAYGTDSLSRSNRMMEEFVKLKLDSNDVRASLYFKNKDYLETIANNGGRYELNDTLFTNNSKYSDFAPSFYQEGLIFSSDRDTGNLARYRHTWNSQDFLDLYKVDAESVSGNTLPKVEFENYNTTRVHESTTVFTKDGKTMYFTGSNFKDGRYIRDSTKMVRLQIFRANYDDGVWKVEEPLRINSDNYSVAHPALSPDDKTLYFVSDKPGPDSKGKSDIYRININDNGDFIDEPEILKGDINTEARETFPFVSSEGILYFSSDGHSGLGGLDVFWTTIEDDKPKRQVKNIGRPINSEWDDFTFIINDDTKIGYFASNREKGIAKDSSILKERKKDKASIRPQFGEDDIYGFIKSSECIQSVTGTVRDIVTNEILIGASVIIMDGSDMVIDSTFTDANGMYSLNLDRYQENSIRAIMKGYIPSEEYYGISVYCEPPKIIDFYLEKPEIECGDDLSTLIPKLRNIYFKFDEALIEQKAKDTLQIAINIMKKYPSLRLKLNSHTDSRGPKSYNLKLSKERAQATLDYMVISGIEPYRLTAEGFGEEKLVNKCSDDVKCSAKEHQFNRRSEFIICGD